MHLPFIQIANEAMDLIAVQVAVTLNADELAILGGLNHFYRWAIQRCPDHLPPSASAVVPGPVAAKLIARAARYTKDPEPFVAAMVAASALEPTGDGIRICGLDRYDQAWAKNHPDLWKQYRAVADTVPPGSRPETGRKPELSRPETGHQTQTQTQTHIEAPPTTTAPAEVLKPADPPPSAVPDPEAIRAFVEFEEARAEHFGGIPVPNPPPSWEADFPVLLKSHEGDRDWALQTYRHFWTDPWAQKLRPPGALQAFIKPEQWVKHVRPREAGPEPGLLGAPQAQELWQQSGTPTALWALVLALMRQDGQGFLSERFAKLRPGLPKNGTVQLFAADPFTRTWALDFGQLVEQYLGQALGEAVAVEFPEPEARAVAGGGA